MDRILIYDLSVSWQRTEGREASPPPTPLRINCSPDRWILISIPFSAWKVCTGICLSGGVTSYAQHRCSVCVCTCVCVFRHYCSVMWMVWSLQPFKSQSITQQDTGISMFSRLLSVFLGASLLTRISLFNLVFSACNPHFISYFQHRIAQRWTGPPLKRHHYRNVARKYGSNVWIIWWVVVVSYHRWCNTFLFEREH